MRKAAYIAGVLFLLASSSSILAQSQKHSADERRELRIEDVVISGTQVVDSAELAEITGPMAGSTFNDDREELQDRIRAQFQDHGFYVAVVKHLDTKIIDPLAQPKLVRLEAEVDEGPRFRVSGIEVTGNHALSSEELLRKFAIKPGEDFKRSKIVAGVESMRKLYGARGFTDFVLLIGDHQDSSSTVKLDMEVREGPQYRMGTLEITGPPEPSEALRQNWSMAPGSVFEYLYPRKFLDENNSLLPADFMEANGLALFKDCSDYTISVHIHLKQDVEHASRDHEKQVDCPSASEKKEKGN